MDFMLAGWFVWWMFHQESSKLSNFNSKLPHSEVRNLMKLRGHPGVVKACETSEYRFVLLVCQGIMGNFHWFLSHEVSRWIVRKTPFSLERGRVPGKPAGGARCFRLPPEVLHCHGVCEWHRSGTPPGASSETDRGSLSEASQWAKGQGTIFVYWFLRVKRDLCKYCTYILYVKMYAEATVNHTVVDSWTPTTRNMFAHLDAGLKGRGLWLWNGWEARLDVISSLTNIIFQLQTQGSNCQVRVFNSLPNRPPLWDGSPWTLRADGRSVATQSCLGCGTSGPDTWAPAASLSKAWTMLYRMAWHTTGFCKMFVPVVFVSVSCYGYFFEVFLMYTIVFLFFWLY